MRTASYRALPGPAQDLSQTTVVVTRSWGDIRRIEVPLSALRRPRLTDREGGHGRRTPYRVLAALLNCGAIPEGAPFGHDCRHGSGGRGSHEITVLVHRTGNDRAAYAQLRAEAEAHDVRKQLQAAAAGADLEHLRAALLLLAA